MAKYENVAITRDFLESNPTAFYVFPDNLERVGCEITSLLRDHPQSIGFVAKKFPDLDEGSFYKPEEYSAVFFEELLKLKTNITKHPERTYYIACMKGPSVNKYKIWEKLMVHNIVLKLQKLDNVVFCWDDKF
jgi:hypothetical protein